MDKPKNILITGATGLIGTRLTELLTERGHQVFHLSRSRKSSAIKSFQWDIQRQTLDPASLEVTDVIIHLAGAPVSEKRWTKKRMDEIIESRTASTQLLFHSLKQSKSSVKTFISASGINYYGYGDSKTIFTEDSAPANDFLAKVTRQWEEEAERVSELGIRVVRVRIGVVLSDRGGALKELARPVKWLAGAALGSGDQVLSWIHIDDLCGIIMKAIDDDSIRGAYNAVAPNPVSNREMMKAIAKVLHKPLFLPDVPSFLLKIILGGMAEMVVRGINVSGAKIREAGYAFRYSKLKDALRDLLDR
jgi:uncharacterized protein